MTSIATKPSGSKYLLKRFYQKTIGRFAPGYEQELERAVGDCRTLLDVGCGAYSPIKSFSAQSKQRLDATGVDAFGPSIERSRADGIHNYYVQMDILKIAERFAPTRPGARHFECVLASDVIEHLPKEDGYKLLDQMESIAGKRVVVFTPNGFVRQGEYDKNPWQVHRSGWTRAEFEQRGYRVIGIGGLKRLKGEYGAIRFWPTRVWYVIADLTQRFVRGRPEHAYQLLAVKEMRPTPTVS
ncbi:MAG: SAM-dependent methyltransferase [bacterium]|nr:SAM-dependent methyltransferase [bacterium]